MHIEKLIDQVKIVSFDIFDTLIWRIYKKPTDLFKHLEEAEACKGFADARIAAEKNARKRAAEDGKAEVSFKDIYDRMDRNYFKLKEKEIALELSACRQNKAIRPVYEYAQQKQKRIVFTSDMYLPQEIIEEILKNAGFTNYEKLFLSSSVQKTKADGSLYEELIAYAGVSPQEILHIGDHAYTDIHMAEKKGLMTYHYTQSAYSDCQMMHSAYFSTLNKYAGQGAASSVLQGIIREKDADQSEENQEDYWYRFGFDYMGILALGYVKWLKAQFDSAGIKKAYFMLRDGYIFKKVFEKLYPDFEVHEVFGSRRMFLFAGMQRFEDVQMNVTGINMQGLNYRNFWDRLYIEDDELELQYRQAFPHMDKIIVSKEEIAELEKFLKRNLYKMTAYGKKERREILSYFDEIHLLDDKAAIVDLGWKCSMLKGICKLCDIEHLPHHLHGYYLGTHACTTEGMDVHSYGIDHGMAHAGYSIGEVLKNSYAVSVLELAFSAPHPSVLKVKKSGHGYEPVYQEVVKEESQRMEVSSRILAGVLDFAERFETVNNKYPLNISLNTALSPIAYIAEHISQYDKKKISEISLFMGVGADRTHFPISSNGMVTIGVINPWPGDVSAEMEVVERIRQAAGDLRIGFVALDDFGCVLDGQQKRTGRYIQPSEVDFVISTHYETHKTVDAFYYHTLWNPPEIPLNLDYYYERVTANYIMNDDFLIYDSGGMTNHLKSMLHRKPRNLNGASMLTASCPESYMLKPNLKHPMMFYCGMNWEKLVHHTNRHEGLFKLLDATKKVNFYGPESVKAWDGLRPWEGYQCYKGQIPFDGKSILKEVNRCGVCLVISSDIHRRAGSATNRVYEACAAGAVIISDENAFMLKWFKDAALFINYNKNDPKDTFRQIMEKYKWIVNHKKEALALAGKAQKIFRRYFALDKQLYKIVNHHASRVRSVQKDLFAKDDTQRVIVTYVVTTLHKKQAHKFLKQVVENIENQYYRNISLSVACDYAIYEDSCRFLEKITARAQVYPMEIFDQKGSQKLTVGECIGRLWKLTDGKYLMNAVADEIWFYDHVTTLVRTIEDEHTAAAYSGRLALHSDGLRRVDSFEPITNNTVYHMQCPDWVPTPGQVLFLDQAKNIIPEYMLSCLDGYEHYALLALYKLKKRQALGFSRRMTYVTRLEREDRQCRVLEGPFQIRFIRDLIQEEMIEALKEENVTSGISRREMKEILVKIPVRLWLVLRLYLKRYLHADLSSQKGKKIEKKYKELLTKFLNT